MHPDPTKTTEPARLYTTDAAKRSYWKSRGPKRSPAEQATARTRQTGFPGLLRMPKTRGRKRPAKFCPALGRVIARRRIYPPLPIPVEQQHSAQRRAAALRGES